MADTPSFDELPDLLTVDEVRRFLRLGRNTVYRLVQDGEVRSLRVGRTIRVPKESLREFLDRAH